MVSTPAMRLSALLVIAIAACTPYDPSLSETPFFCGSGDPQCPDGYQCVQQATGSAVLHHHDARLGVWLVVGHVREGVHRHARDVGPLRRTRHAGLEPGDRDGLRRECRRAVPIVDADGDRRHRLDQRSELADDAAARSGELLHADHRRPCRAASSISPARRSM